MTKFRVNMNGHQTDVYSYTLKDWSRQAGKRALHAAMYGKHEPDSDDVPPYKRGAEDYSMHEEQIYPDARPVLVDCPLNDETINLAYRLKNLLRAQGVDDVRIHGLRLTFDE